MPSDANPLPARNRQQSGTGLIDGLSRRSLLTRGAAAAAVGIAGTSLVGVGSVAAAEPRIAAAHAHGGLGRQVFTSDWSVLTAWIPKHRKKKDVFIYPSLGRAGADFDVLVAALVSDGHRVMTLDPLTVNNTATSNVGLTGLASDALGLLDQAGAHTFHVIGHAFGSRVIRQMSITYPSRVASITCLACGGQVPPTPAAAAALPRCYDLTLSNDDRVEALATAFFAPGHDPSVWLDGWFPGTAAGEGAAGSGDGSFFDGGPQRMLIIQGTHDTVAPPGNADQLKAARAGRTKVVKVNAGHALMPEQPARIINEVVTFYDAIE